MRPPPPKNDVPTTEVLKITPDNRVCHGRQTCLPRNAFMGQLENSLREAQDPSFANRYRGSGFGFSCAGGR